MPVSDDKYSAYNPREPEQEAPGPVGYLALVVAWVVPGAGHVMIGQVGRGLIMGIAIHLLFAAGLLLGGIHAINPPDQPIWTYTQFLTGWPMLVANHLERNVYEPMYVPKEPRGSNPAPPAPIQEIYNKEAQDRGINLDDMSPAGLEKKAEFTKEFIAEYPLFAYQPKVLDQGSVYCGIAGMLNLLVMFDVLLRITGSVREDPAALRKQRRAARQAGQAAPEAAR